MVEITASQPGEISHFVPNADPPAIETLMPIATKTRPSALSRVVKVSPAELAEEARQGMAAMAVVN